MNLLADEGVDRAIVDRLRQEGHDVVYVAELSPSLSRGNPGMALGSTLGRRDGRDRLVMSGFLGPIDSPAKGRGSTVGDGGRRSDARPRRAEGGAGVGDRP